MHLNTHLGQLQVLARLVLRPCAEEVNQMGLEWHIAALVYLLCQCPPTLTEGLYDSIDELLLPAMQLLWKGVSAAQSQQERIEVLPDLRSHKRPAASHTHLQGLDLWTLYFHEQILGDCRTCLLEALLHDQRSQWYDHLQLDIPCWGAIRRFGGLLRCDLFWILLFLWILLGIWLLLSRCRRRRGANVRQRAWLWQGCFRIWHEGLNTKSLDRKSPNEGACATHRRRSALEPT
mmetsp:Transcript_13808/g.32936  ORF Transcript_13808/g.32936 Transcript_13808/m.32936 type:complete len:233 (-) Transcript_13808:337-1035(-)